MTAIWTGDSASRLRRDLNAGGSQFCGDCPLKLPLKKDDAPPQRDLDVAPAAVPAVHRVHRGLQHLVRPGLLRAGNRHHAHPAGRHARLRSVPARGRRGRTGARPRSISSTTAKRSCTSARSRCASTSKRAFRTSISTRAPTASRSPRSRRAGWCTPASTRSRSRSTARRRRATPGTASAASSTRRSGTCARRPTRSGAPAATSRSSTGATSCSPTTTATRR